jgi:glycosyltransferase involved in cell wall biosynthesis
MPYFHSVLEPMLRLPDVKWIGDAAHDEKVRLFGQAVATLSPIDWEEPFGLVMIESMLCGTPVIAFRRGSVPEIVDEGITGWIVANVDEMASMLFRLASGAQPFNRARCRQHAARRFNAERMISDYIAIYKRAVDASRCRT